MRKSQRSLETKISERTAKIVLYSPIHRRNRDISVHSSNYRQNLSFQNDAIFAPGESFRFFWLALYNIYAITSILYMYHYHYFVYLTYTYEKKNSKACWWLGIHVIKNLQATCPLYGHVNLNSIIYLYIHYIFILLCIILWRHCVQCTLYLS